MAQKNQSLEDELIAATDTLYSKSVPANVREFIELRAGAGGQIIGQRGKRK